MAKKKGFFSLNKVTSDQDEFALLCHYTYIYVGKYFLKNQKFQKFFNENVYVKKYEDILQQANFKILPEEFFMTSFIWNILLVLIYSIIIGIMLIYFPTYLNFPLFFIGIFIVALGGIAFYNYPSYQAGERGRKIDAAIPHILPYLKLLSSDLKIANIIVLMDEFIIYSEIKKEFEKIRYYNEFLGQDLVTAIKNAMKTCPSKRLSEIMNDIIVISNSGGDVYSYLDTKVEHQHQEIESTEKQVLESTMILSQIYIVFLLIGPLLTAVVLSIFSFISFATVVGDGGALSGGSSTQQIIYFIIMLILLPIFYGLFYFVVYLVKPEYSKIRGDINESE